MTLHVSLSQLVSSVTLACAMLATPAFAHPGAGIVVDRHGNVYFVLPATNHLMKIDRSGRVTEFARDERLNNPHHLTYGRDGHIYVASDDDARVYRIDSTGALALHFDAVRVNRRAPVRVGAWGDPFTVDSAGNIYALAEPNGRALVRIAPDGAVTPLASRARFSPLHFATMAWGPDGALYLTDEWRVWRITGDSARSIVPRGQPLGRAAGLALDGSGNLYVVDYLERRIVRLAPDGTVNTPAALARRSFRAPTGVAVAGDTVFVLDNGTGSTAVFRLVEDDLSRVYTESFWKWHLRYFFLALGAVLLFLLIANRRLRNRQGAHLSAAAAAD